MRGLGLLCFVMIFLCSAETALASLHGHTEEEGDKAIEAKIPSLWRYCDTTLDCGVVTYNCGNAIASNKAYLSEATEIARKIGGDPLTMECAELEQKPFYIPLCLENLCYAVNPHQYE